MIVCGKVEILQIPLDEMNSMIDTDSWSFIIKPSDNSVIMEREDTKSKLTKFMKDILGSRLKHFETLLQNKLQAMRTKILELEEQNHKLEKFLRGQKESNDLLLQRLSNSESIIKRLKADVDSARRENASIEEERSYMDNYTEELDGRIKKLEEQNLELQKKLEEKDRKAMGKENVDYLLDSDSDDEVSAFSSIKSRTKKRKLLNDKIA